MSVEKCLVKHHSLNGKPVELKRAVKKDAMGKSQYLEIYYTILVCLCLYVVSYLHSSRCAPSLNVLLIHQCALNKRWHFTEDCIMLVRRDCNCTKLAESFDICRPGRSRRSCEIKPNGLGECSQLVRPIILCGDYFQPSPQLQLFDVFYCMPAAPLICLCINTVVASSKTACALLKADCDCGCCPR